MRDERTRLKSLDELRQIRERAKADTDLRTRGARPDRVVLKVGMATCGIAAGARGTMLALREAVEKNGLEHVSIVATGCFGLCYAEPMVEVLMPGMPGIRYGKVDAARAGEIIERHVMRGELIDSAIVSTEVEGV